MRIPTAKDNGSILFALKRRIYLKNGIVQIVSAKKKKQRIQTHEDISLIDSQQLDIQCIIICSLLHRNNDFYLLAKPERSYFPLRCLSVIFLKDASQSQVLLIDVHCA